MGHAIWWQIYPLGFTGADTSGRDRNPTHRLTHLQNWLDYAIGLGASGIALGPIFASSSHGYDTIDFYRIDPRLGDDADFAQLIAAAHARGLRVLLDGVFNHVGREFPAFIEVSTGDPSSPTANWFVRDEGSESGYATFEGHPGLIALNHDSPDVIEFVVDVMAHWLDRGADGWRLDAAYAVPTEFWAKVLPRVRTTHPDAYFVGEVIHGDYAEIIRQSTLDAVTQYELWKAIWSSLNDLNLFEVSWALQRHDGYLDTFRPMTFIGNHDVTRIASRLEDARHLPHALVVLLTVGGTPSIYYGDEQAFAGVKTDQVGGDDAVRPAYPHAPDGLLADGWNTYRLHQDLIGLRRRHSWLHGARVEIIELRNEQLVYDAVDGPNRLRIAINLADTDLRHDAGGDPQILLGSASIESQTVVVPGHCWAIIEIADRSG